MNFPFVTSKLFSLRSNLIFGCTTREGGVSSEPFGMNISFSVNDNETDVQKNREIFFRALGVNANQVAFTKQIHSNIVQIVTSPGVYEQCDALITNIPNLFLFITVADCAPVFLYDKRNNVVAAIHSRWRGCVNGILYQALLLLQKEFNTQGKDINCFIGPCAGKCCYEIKKDVASFFDGKFLKEINENTFLLDMKSILIEECKKFQIPDDNIELSNVCTIHEKKYHSFRRDGKLSGRMGGLIGIKSFC